MELKSASNIAEIRRRLEAVGQSHVLRFYDELDSAGQRALLEQIETLNIERLPRLVEQYVRSRKAFTLPDTIEPAPYYARDARSWDRHAAKKQGEKLLREGAIAAFTVAGGQGTRLGFDGPKGTYFATAITRKPLFRCLAEWIESAKKRYGRPVPWYIMTSPLNHAETVAFFQHHGYFGLGEQDVMFFAQGVLPSLDMHSGALLLAEKGVIATNPDGHGGSLRAIVASGALDDMRRRGVRHLSYVQIDNPLARAIDPVFIGLHADAPDSSAEMSSKMVAKTDPAEKVGLFCKAEGKTRVIEYSDMPREKVEERDPRTGALRYNAGSIAMHMISVDFIARLNTGGELLLPLHRAEKKVPHIDIQSGQPVNPAAPNAVKMEAFVFDALPLCASSIVMEADRIDEFAPIKNAEGNDSPRTCRDIQTERAARWLESRGARVPRAADGTPDCILEISPLAAWEAEELDAEFRSRQILPGEEWAI